MAQPPLRSAPPLRGHSHFSMLTSPPGGVVRRRCCSGCGSATRARRPSRSTRRTACSASTRGVSRRTSGWLLRTMRRSRSRCGRPTTWTILQHDGPDHLGLCYNALPEHQMALIASGCAPSRRRTPRRPGARSWTSGRWTGCRSRLRASSSCSSRRATARTRSCSTCTATARCDPRGQQRTTWQLPPPFQYYYSTG